MLSQLRTGMSCYALDRHCWMPVVIAQKNHQILVLTTLFGMLLAQSELEIACSHSCRIQDTCRPCSACSNENNKIASESVVYLRERYSLELVDAACL